MIYRRTILSRRVSSAGDAGYTPPGTHRVSPIRKSKFSSGRMGILFPVRSLLTHDMSIWPRHESVTDISMEMKHLHPRKPRISEHRAIRDSAVSRPRYVTIPEVHQVESARADRRSDLSRARATHTSGTPGVRGCRKAAHSFPKPAYRCERSCKARS